LKALGKLFLQILQFCEKAGLVKAMSYERMEKRARGVGAEVAN
jgi:hypothetical protein